MAVAAHPFHAYLIELSPGAYLEYAKQAAMANLCPNGGGDGCGICARIQSGNHPDLLVVEGEKGTIKVDAVRSLIAQLGRVAYEGGKRLVAIFNAQDMTVQAQNALLKTLEEPPQDTTFLLFCGDGSALLPTIRSRCMTVRPQANDTTALDQLNLPQQTKDALLAYARDAQDALLLAEEMQGETGRWQARQTALAFINAIHNNSPLAVGTELLGEDKAQLNLVLWALLQCFSHAIMVSLSQPVATDAAETNALKPFEKRPADVAARCVQITQRAQDMLSSNVQTKLCKDWLYIELGEVIHEDGRRH
ncbi:hypothetical protein LJC55_03730 [Eubacteriales bacterium OttesenSCG-928-N14]|nr:hypothetical protein [Eubacteriales bacterium OttesenSCG-928-N14]